MKTYRTDRETWLVRYWRPLALYVGALIVAAALLWGQSRPRYAAVDRLEGTLVVLIHDDRPDLDVVKVAAHLPQVREGLVYRVVIHRLDTTYTPDERETRRRLSR